MGLTQINVKGGGVKKPIVRYVYLVNDLSDAARMGGTSDNSYTNYQLAYNAADALQIALGGTNRVVIQVGVTTAAGVGNCSVVTWNSNVLLVGIHRLLSNVGILNITTVSLATIRLKDLNSSTINSEGGLNVNFENASIFGALNTNSTTGNAGLITVSGSNSSTGNLSATSTAGNSGAITAGGSNLVIGNILQTTSLGNVGTLSISGLTESSIGSITRTATDPVGNRTIGQFAVANSRSNLFGAITMIITNPLSTGTIDVFIGRTNQANIFNGTVTIQGCAGSARSDVGIDLQFINCTFNQPLLVNTAGTFVSERGGWIKRLDIQDCKFFLRARFVNWPINPQTTDPIVFDLTVNIKNCNFFPLSGLGGLYFQNNDVGYAKFLIKDCESNDPSVGISLGTNVPTPPVIPWMIDSEYIDYQNIKSFISIQTYDPVLNPAPYCAILNNCNGSALFLAAYEDFNFQVNMCNYEVTGYEWGHGALPLTRPWYINSSRLGAATGNPSFNWGGIGGPLDLIIKNSYFGFYADILNPQAISIPAAYNSFIESIADVGSTSTYTGTLFTSTIRRLVTEIVAGLTFNNSYDDPY